MNPQPLRVVFLTTPAAKDWLRTALSPGNLDKTLAAPVVAIWAHDLAFPERLPQEFPHKADAKMMFEASRNSSRRPLSATARCMAPTSCLPRVARV